jgi:hypothetical protein
VDIHGNSINCGAGGSGVTPGTQYQIPAYNLAGTSLQGTNVTTDSTGNDLNIPGLIRFPNDLTTNTQILVGSGANVANYIGFSSNRAIFGYDGVGQAYIAGGGLGVHAGGIGTTKLAGFNTGGILQGELSTIASALAISPATAVVHVTGTTSVQTMVVPNGCTTGNIACEVDIIADAGFSTLTGGNIAAGVTLSAGSSTVFVYDSANTIWYIPSTAANISGAQIFNGISYCANYPGSTIDVQVNACISDAENLANGNTTGIADASGLSGTHVTAATITVGTLNGLPVVLKLPANGQWLGGMTDGTSATMQQYGGTSIIGSSTASGAGTLMVIGATLSSSLGTVFKTLATLADQLYFYDSGFAIVNLNNGSFQGAATTSGIGVTLTSGTFDVSTWEHMVFFDNLDAIVVDGSSLCCMTTFRGVSINASYGGTPLVLGNLNEVNILDSSVVHPGSGLPVIQLVDSTFHGSVANIKNLYIETSNASTSGTLITSSGYKVVNIEGLTAVAGTHGMTADLMTIANVGTPSIRVSGATLLNGSGDWEFTVAGNIVNSYTGETIPTDANGSIGLYVSGYTNLGVTQATSLTTTGAIAATGAVSGSTFTGGLFAYESNYIRVVDGVHYPLTEAGVQSCINDAIAASGTGAVTCDARAVPSITLATELEVGNSSAAALTLLLPQHATWSVSITDGTHCGIRQYQKSAIIGQNTASNGIQFTIAPSSSATNVEGLYCTEDAPTGGGSYVYGEGFAVTNNVGATMARGAFVAQHLFDDSTYRNVRVTASSGVGAKIYDVCCGTSFYNLLVDGSSGSGARPAVLGDTVLGGSVINGALFGVAFYSMSATHPGAGNYIIELGDSTNSSNYNAFDSNISFYNLYMEPNATDTTTAAVEIRPAVHSVSMHDFDFSNSVGGSTAYVVRLENWAGPSDSVFEGGHSQTGNVINDLILGNNISVNGAYNQAPPYWTPLLPGGGGLGCTLTTPGSICYWNGTSAVTLAGNASGTNWLQETSSGVPSWTAPSGSGNVSNVGTPTSGQIAQWTSATLIQGVTGTGTGTPVLATSPTLVTPVLGAATATTINALPLTATGSENVQIGHSAGNNAAASGSFTTAVGYNAASALTSAGSNVAIGEGTLASITTGADNTAVGTGAGTNSTTLTTNSDSVFVGYLANASANALTNDTVLGYQAQATASNQVVIGNSSVTGTLLHGIVTAGALGQPAASNYGGTCAMSTSTSCTITLAYSYTTPVCIVTQQSATLTGGAAGCTVSGTTATITAAVANSETWGALVFGNPN